MFISFVRVTANIKSEKASFCYIVGKPFDGNSLLARLFKNPPMETSE